MFTYSSEFRYTVNAEQPEIIENDIRANAALVEGLHCYITAGWENWFLLDTNKKAVEQGILKKVNKDYTEFSETYKLLPPKGNVLGYMQWDFIKDTGPEKSTMQYDVFICSGTKNKSAADYPVTPWLYKDLTVYYQNKYPEADVKAAVICYRIDY